MWKRSNDSNGHATVDSSGKLYDTEAAPFTLKVRMLKAEEMETLLDGCVTWPPGKEHLTELRTAHHMFLKRTIDCLPAPTTHRPPHLVRQDPQERMRGRRGDLPQTASPL